MKIIQSDGRPPLEQACEEFAKPGNVLTQINVHMSDGTIVEVDIEDCPKDAEADD